MGSYLDAATAAEAAAFALLSVSVLIWNFSGTVGRGVIAKADVGKWSRMMEGITLKPKMLANANADTCHC